jgi:hypothetical protein
MNILDGYYKVGILGKFEVIQICPQERPALIDIKLVFKIFAKKGRTG